MRTDNDTPDSDDRSRKKVRWNSDSLVPVDGDKLGDSEENKYEDNVGSYFPVHSCHKFRRHLIHPCVRPRRPARRFV
jgi:hypothetical protein